MVVGDRSGRTTWPEGQWCERYREIRKDSQSTTLGCGGKGRTLIRIDLRILNTDSGSQGMKVVYLLCDS